MNLSSTIKRPFPTPGRNLWAGVLLWAALLAPAAAPAHPLRASALPLAAAGAPRRRTAAMPVTALAFSPDGKLLAVGGYEEVQFRDALTGRRVATWSGHSEAVHALVFSRDGRR